MGVAGRVWQPAQGVVGPEAWHSLPVLLVLVLWPLRGSACPPSSPGSLRETARS